MKKLFVKLFIIITFILTLTVMPSFADFLEISSITFDNSETFMTLNSIDNLDYPLEKTQINVDKEKSEVYFDIKPARIKSNKSYIVNSKEIAEIDIFQISTTPDIVRIKINYKENFNPSNISIKRLNNTIFIKFKKTTMANYYFQETYKESPTNIIDEQIKIQEKIQTQKNLVSEINSAFSNQQTSNNDNDNDNDYYVLSEKNLILKSKFYINGITIKGETPIIQGTGSYTLTKPIYLSSPNRVAYDIKNTVVNPLLRNRDISIGNDTIKIGQFDHNTARIVITSENPENYLPIIYPDSQKLAFLNTANTSPLNLYSETSNMTAISKEKNYSNNYATKFSFSKPIIFGLNRTTDKIELYLFNLKNYFSGAITSELRNTPFESIKIIDIKSGGAKLVIPDYEKNQKYDIYMGADGKTLRIKLKTTEPYVQKEEPIEEIIIPKVIQSHTGNKKYVVIDAGHGGSDCGAIRNEINEKDITLDIAKKVQEMLEKKGYVVAMTRTDDTYVSLQDRVDFSEVFNPDIFISIHVNSSNSQTPSGIETHYYKDNSLTLAKYMHASMLNHINSKDRGLFKSKFYVINHTTAPAILIEIGFLSNPTERAQLITESRKNTTAKAIVEGIDEYFKK